MKQTNNCKQVLLIFFVFVFSCVFFSMVTSQCHDDQSRLVVFFCFNSFVLFFCFALDLCFGFIFVNELFMLRFANIICCAMCCSVVSRVDFFCLIFCFFLWFLLGCKIVCVYSVSFCFYLSCNIFG